jgi:hypothetical protein
LNDVNASPSQRFDYAFWNEMFNGSTNATNIGKVNQLSKETFIGEVNNTLGRNLRYCYYEINLLGDPETPFIIPAAVLGTTAAAPEATETVIPAAEPASEPKAETEEKQNSGLDMPDLFGDGMSFDANTFEFEEIKFDFGGGVDFGDSMKF